MSAQGKTILVVEDNNLNMKLAVDLLELQGLSVLQAVNAEECFSVLQKFIPDLILLDINLPVADGFEIFNKIRADKRTAGVKVGVLTAMAMSEEREKIIAAGFNAYIPKPIDKKDFIKRINDLLGTEEK